jgi:hypothetical protein
MKKSRKVKSLRWWMRYRLVKLKQVFKTMAPGRETRRVSFPDKISSEERTALRIWAMVVHQDESELMYDPQTYESYAEYQGPGGPVYLFLESRNLRVVNTVVGYDVRLSAQAELWATSIFNLEIHKRRSHFKAEVNSKIHHSLSALEERLHSQIYVQSTESSYEKVLQN